MNGLVQFAEKATNNLQVAARFIYIWRDRKREREMKRRLKSSLLRCSEYDMPVAVTVTFLAKSSKRNLTFICSFFNKLLFEQQVIFCHQSDSCVHSSSRVRLLFIRSSREFSLDYASLISRSQSTGDFRRHYFTCPQKWILSLSLALARSHLHATKNVRNDSQAFTWMAKKTQVSKVEVLYI